MATRDLSAAFSLCPLFKNVPKEMLDALINTGKAIPRRFHSGDELPLSLDDERALVVLSDGLALAYSTDAERSVILRSIPPGTAFGVSILFSDEEPVSVIRAKGAAEAIYLPSSAVLALIEESADFRMNYIAFLSGRIRFLNRRIACYTAGSAERRLALYLADLPEIEPNIAHLDTSLSDLSELLDIGRASLYRAFARLTKDSLIERDDRRVRILDRQGLMHYGGTDEAS